MAEIIRMPKMSDTMTEGVVVAWHKKVGDTVKVGDILAEVETDKATMELENYVKGVLLHIGIEQGQAVPVDALIAIVGKEGEDVSALLSGGPAAPVGDAKTLLHPKFQQRNPKRPHLSLRKSLPAKVSASRPVLWPANWLQNKVST